jgi:hypothetical protein
MILDTDGNRILSAHVAIESGGNVTGSFQVECESGWVIAGSAVADITCEVKHSAGAYVDIESNTIDLATWDGTTQTFNFRFASSTAGIRRHLPLVVRRG